MWAKYAYILGQVMNATVSSTIQSLVYFPWKTPDDSHHNFTWHWWCSIWFNSFNTHQEQTCCPLMSTFRKSDWPNMFEPIATKKWMLYGANLFASAMMSSELLLASKWRQCVLLAQPNIDVCKNKLKLLTFICVCVIGQLHKWTGEHMFPAQHVVANERRATQRWS